MFPPQKKSDSAPPKKPAGPGGPPQGGPPQGGPPGGAPPDPFAGGGDPFGPAAASGPPGAPGMDPFAAAAPPPMGPPPGMPKPGQGMDPMQAMLQGIGPDPLAQSPQPQGPPMGPDGMPVGGSMPPMGQGGDDEMGGSSLLQALTGALGGGGQDPYGVPPMGPGMGFEGMGTGDPNGGLEQMLQMLALGQMGVNGGAPGPGSSGLDPGPFGNMGQMVGM